MKLVRFAVPIAILVALQAKEQNKVPMQGSDVRDKPVGLVLAASGGTLQRAGRQATAQAHAGDILFAGDVLTAHNDAKVLFCPKKLIRSLEAGSEVVVGQDRLSLRSGGLGPSEEVRSCELPSVNRTEIASRQQHGGALIRAASTKKEPPRPGGLPDVPQSTDAPLSHLARALFFEKQKLYPDAAREYELAAQSWPDATWIRHRAVEAASRSASAPKRKGQTYALLVGISKYRSTSVQPLRFADRDAIAFRRFLKSNRGGSLPDSHVLTLTNEQATTNALRLSLNRLRTAETGANDTVILLLSAHGVAQSGMGSFVVTYDTDPRDIGNSALPLTEISEFVQEIQSRHGRVIVYVDVSRSGNIGAVTIDTAALNSGVQQLQETSGDLFLLSASRAGEVSVEGDEFGGGHGAFTHSLLRALNGEADADANHIVDVNEVIEHVRSNVAESTSGRQHPCDFGTLDNNYALAGLRQPGEQMRRAAIEF